MSTTDYLAPLNFGTGVAESTSTLGQDRLDVQIPGDQYHLSNLQLARHNQLLLLLSQYLKGGARVQVIPQGSNPFGASESGLYIDSVGSIWRVFNGAASQISTGSSLVNTSVKTSAYAASIGDRILVDPTGGAFTVTLPTAVGFASQTIAFKNVGASSSVVTVATTSAQTIDGSSTYSINAGHEAVSFVSDGSNWMVF